MIRTAGTILKLIFIIYLKSCRRCTSSRPEVFYKKGQFFTKKLRFKCFPVDLSCGSFFGWINQSNKKINFRLPLIFGRFFLDIFYMVFGCLHCLSEKKSKTIFLCKSNSLSSMSLSVD